ncbi:hypothetical protein STEG23_037736, partial [Scotinomys teguina]
EECCFMIAELCPTPIHLNQIGDYPNCHHGTFIEKGQAFGKYQQSKMNQVATGLSTSPGIKVGQDLWAVQSLGPSPSGNIRGASELQTVTDKAG